MSADDEPRATVKALTLHQPWASLVALGVKTIETRSWATRYRGPLAIHAGITKGDPREPAWGPLLAEPGGAMLREDVRPLPLAAIVATCTLADVVPMVEGIPPQDEWREPWRLLTLSPWPILTSWRGFGSAEAERVYADQRPYGDFAPGRYAWLLDDVKPTTERCPACWGDGARWRDGRGSMLNCRTCHGIRTCEPVPAKGRQGLWEWTP